MSRFPRLRRLFRFPFRTSTLTPFVRYRGGKPVGIRVVGEHRVCLCLGGEFECEVERSFLFGVGKTDCGERAVRLELGRNRREPGVTRPGEHLCDGIGVGVEDI